MSVNFNFIADLKKTNISKYTCRHTYDRNSRRKVMTIRRKRKKKNIPNISPDHSVSGKEDWFQTVLLFDNTLLTVSSHLLFAGNIP